MGSSGDVGRVEGRVQLLFCCSTRHKTRGLNLGKWRPITSLQMKVTFCSCSNIHIYFKKASCDIFFFVVIFKTCKGECGLI